MPDTVATAFSRRSALRASGIVRATGLAGCSWFSSSPEEDSLVASQQVSMQSSECLGDDDRPHLASASYRSSDRRLEVNGRVKAPNPCPSIELTVETGDETSASDDGAVHLVVDPSTGGGCPPCPAAVRYSATVEFDADPSEIRVYHLEETDEGWTRAGAIATATPE